MKDGFIENQKWNKWILPEVVLNINEDENLKIKLLDLLLNMEVLDFEVVIKAKYPPKRKLLLGIPTPGFGNVLVQNFILIIIIYFPTLHGSIIGEEYTKAANVYSLLY
ncbi:4817_t:CDS:1 [Diversispora eburnea]|uniref:4817_t:CDS:1 n=1 Tax=Diversispora eburnea TaxID=1213867 RepID=A0A9N9APR5_9GLOM|nr:4817_t:CDS:1 [Diversispora eburnea]